MVMPTFLPVARIYQCIPSHPLWLPDGNSPDPRRRQRTLPHNAPASRSSDVHPGTCLCGFSLPSRQAFRKEIEGTNSPSITSTCSQGTPAPSTALISSPSFQKSAERIEGDKIFMILLISAPFRALSATLFPLKRKSYSVCVYSNKLVFLKQDKLKGTFPFQKFLSSCLVITSILYRFLTSSLTAPRHLHALYSVWDIFFHRSHSGGEDPLVPVHRHRSANSAA